MSSRLLFLLGTIQWLAFTIVHPVLVDIDLVLGLHSPIGPEVQPDGDNLRSALIANTWDFGRLGATTAHRALSGFSLWVPTSALFFALINIIIGRSSELPHALLYRLTILNAAAMAVFTLFAFVCFISLPQIGGITGTVLFALAARSMAREQPVSG
jgi:hypothetical protein